MTDHDGLSLSAGHELACFLGGLALSREASRLLGLVACDFLQASQHLLEKPQAQWLRAI